MIKLTVVAIVSLSFSIVYSQQSILIFKKRNKTLANFWKGSTIAFQMENLQWKKGEITKIQNDSFYIRPLVVKYYMMGTDTSYYSVEGYSVSDIYAMPKKGLLIDYKNGDFQISRSGGHVHFYWIKSGWIFRAGALGYAGLNIINGIINNDFSFSESKTTLSIAAAVFLGGVVLHKVYKVTLRTGGKYHIEVLKLSN